MFNLKVMFAATLVLLVFFVHRGQQQSTCPPCPECVKCKDGGVKCTTDRECCEGFYCSQYSKICKKRYEDGVKCGRHESCISGRCGQDGKCQPCAKLGDPCKIYQDCCGSYLGKSRCTNGNCAPW